MCYKHRNKTNMTNTILGIFLVIGSYILVFTSWPYEMLRHTISASAIVGLGYLGIAFGIMGLMIIFEGLRK